MRITDLAVSTPVAGARPATARRAGSDAGPPGALVSAAAREAAHPDAVAETALARAASQAQATKVVAAANEQAAQSVQGDLLNLASVP